MNVNSTALKTLYEQLSKKKVFFLSSSICNLGREVSSKGIVHAKLKFYPFTTHRDVGRRLWCDCLIHVTIPEFQGGKEFHPAEVYCGQGLQRNNR